MPNSAQFCRKHRDLLRRDRIGDRQIDIDRRHIVIRRGDRQIGPPNRPARHAQPVKRLRRGHLMDQMQVDVEQVGFAGRGANDVTAPRPCRPAFSGDWSSVFSVFSYVQRDVDDPAITVDGWLLLEPAKRGHIGSRAGLDDVRRKAMARVEVAFEANAEIDGAPGHPSAARSLRR